MKKVFTSVVFLLFLLGIAKQTFAQIFVFPNVNTTPGCYDGSDYVLHSGVKITGVKVVQIYYDDNVSAGSFSYEILFTYGNIFNGTVNSTGNFWTYTVTMYTDNPNAGGTITNNGSNIPLVTDTVGNMNLHNNPTYNGSASAMGLAVGIYTDPDTIAMFGYDSVRLLAAAPCLNLDEGASANGGTPLAIAVTDLNANLTGSIASINWTTNAEIKNAGFMVQKSTDGRNWSDVVWIASKAAGGDSYLPLSYATEDKNVSNGFNYYRLQQVDINGNKTLSKVIAVVNNSKQDDVTIYPNPTAEILHVTAKTALANQNYVLTNLAGQTILSGTVNGNSADINVATIAGGAYVLKIGGTKEKVMIVR